MSLAGLKAQGDGIVLSREKKGLMRNQKIETRKQNEACEKQRAQWGGVFAMTLCVFALIASEFMPVSLLTPMAHSLNVTEGMAGQGIAISGAFAVVTSLFISRLAGTLDRKILLLGLTGMMALSGADLYGRPRPDWHRRRWVLVDVGGDSDASGTGAPCSVGAGYFQ